MRHLKSGRKLGRNSSHRKAMFRNMATSLLEHGQIITTLAKAKELRKHVEPLITLARPFAPSQLEGLSGDELAKAKIGRLNAIRKARKTVNNKTAMDKLFNDYADHFYTRNGGYTRVIKAGYRAGDNAPMAVIALVFEKSNYGPVTQKEESSSNDEDSTSAEAIEAQAVESE